MPLNSPETDTPLQPRDENRLGPSRLNRQAALRVFRTFFIISLGTPIVFFVYDSFGSGIPFSIVGLIFLATWISGFSLDVWTTHRFYTDDRQNFSVNESNAVFSKLVERFGFTKGLAVQLVVIEIPAALILVVLMHPIFHTFTESDSNGIVTNLILSASSLYYLPVALCLFGVIHMIDGFVNLDMEREKIDAG